MARFIYQAKSKSQTLVEGIIEAESQAEAIQKLSSMNYFPFKIERERFGGTGKNAESSDDLGNVLPVSHRIPPLQISTLFRQLSDLLNSGLPLVAVLKMTAEQSADKTLGKILENMTLGVREGKTLSQVMQEYPAVFIPFYTQLIYAGETGGMLGNVLERLADNTEKEEEIRSQVKAALAYPSFIVVVGIITITFLLGFIIPRMATMFVDFQQMLPLPTRILLGVSFFFKHYWWLFLFLGAFALVVWERKETKEKLSLMRDKIFLNVPIFKSWVLKQEIAHFARTLGSLLENGVTILQALQVSRQTIRNKVFQNEIAPILSKVREGIVLSKCLREIPLFPPYVCNLVAVGEEGGKLDKSLIKIAESYERQAQRDLKVAISLLEPFLILSIGLVLGAIVISIMLPIFEINTLIR